MSEERTRPARPRIPSPQAPNHPTSEHAPTRPQPSEPPPEAGAEGGGDRPRSRDPLTLGLEDVGAYHILETLGEGGMGTVYLAEQQEPIRRRVAVKVLRTTWKDRSLALRFEVERQALARMSHPAIARVYDAGVSDEGHPYLVMEYVPGVPITDYCDEHRLSLEERLQLVRQVCEGVQHAHQKAILHRDLKPTNVLVMEEQGRPAPKIIDFGIAKPLDVPPGEGAMVTLGLVGTPQYLPPEAIEGVEGRTLDTRADVYSLGMMLFRLTVGALPFSAGEGNLLESLRRMTEEAAPKPSALFASLPPAQQEQVARSQRTDRETQRSRIRGDLDRIILKAVAREPEERYASAFGLSADLGRFLRHEPVMATPPSGFYRAAKFVRRNTLGVVAAAAVVLALAAGLTLRTVEARRANREAARANREAAAAQQIAGFLVDLFEVSDPGEARGRTVTASELLERGAEKVRGELTGQPLTRADLMHTIGAVQIKLGLYREAEPLLTEALETRRQQLGEGDPRVAQSVYQLGLLHLHLGRWEEAEPLLQQSLALRRATLGPEHRDVGDSLNALASLYGRQGLLDEAEPYLEQALAVREKALGPDHPDVAVTLHNLAGLAVARKRYDEAVAYQVRALTIRESLLGPDHPDVAFSFEALAVVLSDQGRIEDAVAHHRHALAIEEKALGPDHLEVSLILTNLGADLTALGSYDEAEAALRRCLAIREGVLEPDHPRLAGPLMRLADVLRETGRYEEAESLYLRSLAIRRQAPGPGGQDLAAAREAYAVLLRITGRGVEAAELVQATEVRP